MFGYSIFLPNMTCGDDLAIDTCTRFKFCQADEIVSAKLTKLLRSKNTMPSGLRRPSNRSLPIETRKHPLPVRNMTFGQPL